MAKASSTTADRVKDFGVALDRSSELDGFTVNFVTITKSHDLAPVLTSLPTGKCTCPHWGYLIKGRVIVRYDDHEEALGPGDAFYMSPGHAPEADEQLNRELMARWSADHLATSHERLAKHPVCRQSACSATARLPR